MTQFCSKCHNTNDRTAQRYCSGCHASYMRQWRSERISVKIPAKTPEGKFATGIIVVDNQYPQGFASSGREDA